VEVHGRRTPDSEPDARAHSRALGIDCERGAHAKPHAHTLALAEPDAKRCTIPIGQRDRDGRDE